MFDRRSTFEMFVAMLLPLTDGGAKVTPTYCVNGNHSHSSTYHEFLTEAGFLGQQALPDGKTIYWRTEKGSQLLRVLEELAKLLGGQDT